MILMALKKGCRYYVDYAPTIRSERVGLKVMDDKYRIRKLTPKECWRLMGFSDKDFDKAKNAGVSNTQLYKIAGNSIVVDVLFYIFNSLYEAMPYLFDDIKLSSYFSGCGAFEKALERFFRYKRETSQYVFLDESDYNSLEHRYIKK